VVTAYFHPAGVRGLLYWHALTPAHVVIYQGLANAIAERAERSASAGRSVEPVRQS
jgi:hypothetical protein